MNSKLTISLSIFLFSLSTFSYRAGALAYIFLFTTIFIEIHKSGSVLLSKKTLIAFITINIIVLAASVRHEVHSIYYVKFLAILIYTLFFTTAFIRNMIKVDTLIYACKFFIFAHSSFFAIQLLSYFITGELIDFNNFVREEEATTIYMSKALEDFIIPIRATGLFSEPSFYSMTVFPVTLLLALNQKKITMPILVGIITSLVSLSVAAFFIVSAGVMLVLITSKKINTRFYIAAFFAVLISAPSLYNFAMLRVVDSSDYDAISSRMVIFKEFEERGITNNLIGSGFFWDESKPIGKTRMKGYHTRDSSFYVYLFFTSGALGVLLFSALTILAFKRAPKYIAALLILLFFKYNILAGMFWLTIAIATIFIHYDSLRNHQSNSRRRASISERTINDLPNHKNI